MRGEHFWIQTGTDGKAGSSPHARGALLYYDIILMSIGIIPACAGSTSAPERCCSAPRDHPRMRGEHFACLAFGLTCLGSSPHARGAQPLLMSSCSDIRIIPACAGSTIKQNYPQFRKQDHPRMRGEHEICK